MNRAPKSRHRLSYEGRISWLTLAAVAPAIVVALALLWFGDYSAKLQWTLTIVIVGCFAVFISSTREHMVRPLQTMSNLLAALREGDYSIRARGARAGSALGEVLSEIDVSIFTFDPERRLRLVNRAGEALLAQSMDKLLSKTAEELGLGRCFHADQDEPLTLNFPGASGRWGIRRSTFREQGLPRSEERR